MEAIPHLHLKKLLPETHPHTMTKKNSDDSCQIVAILVNILDFFHNFMCSNEKNFSTKLLRLSLLYSFIYL